MSEYVGLLRILEALGLMGMIFFLDCRRFVRSVCPIFCGYRDAPKIAIVFALKIFFMSPILELV